MGIFLVDNQSSNKLRCCEKKVYKNDVILLI